MAVESFLGVQLNQIDGEIAGPLDQFRGEKHGFEYHVEHYYIMIGEAKTPYTLHGFDFEVPLPSGMNFLLSVKDDVLGMVPMGVIGYCEESTGPVVNTIQRVNHLNSDAEALQQDIDWEVLALNILCDHFSELGFEQFRVKSAFENPYLRISVGLNLLLQQYDMLVFGLDETNIELVTDDNDIVSDIEILFDVNNILELLAQRSTGQSKRHRLIRKLNQVLHGQSIKEWKINLSLNQT